MQNYSVSYTSTETLYAGEKERKQSFIDVNAKTEEEAKQKALELLKSMGRHEYITIHSAVQNARGGKKNPSKAMFIVMLVLAFVILLTIFVRP